MTNRFAWAPGDVIVKPPRSRKSFGDPGNTQERGEGGRFGAAEADTTAGATDAGYAGNTALGDIVSAAVRDVVAGRVGTVDYQRADGLKQANVIATGGVLVERAQSDPQLASQLEAAGERVVNLAMDAYPGEGQYEVMHDRLGFSSPEGVDPKEVGARYIADRLQTTWAATSSDGKIESQALQMAVADRFGLSTSVIEGRAGKGEGVYDKSDTNATYANGAAQALGVATAYDSTVSVLDVARDIADSPAVQAYVDATYERTQSALAAGGVQEVTLFRGMQWMTADAVPEEYRSTYRGPAGDKAEMAPLSSWSTSPRIAGEEFAARSPYGVVLTSTVDASRIFSIPSTGPGCLGENEVVLTGGGVYATVKDGPRS